MPASRGRRAIPLVTLSSDVGWAYAAQMRAVLAHALPPGHLVDLAHDLPPHAIGEAAFVVRAMASGFPAGTVHLVVVDPGVGSRRAPIAVRCRDGSVLVGPDNGVLSPLAAALGGGRAYRIRPDRLPPRARVGATFDGRDLFAPAAAVLARGTAPAALGPPVPLQPAPAPTAVHADRGARGEVVHVDRFGNLITNIPTDWVPPAVRSILVRIDRARARRLPWVTHYAPLAGGRVGLLGSSFGFVEIAVGERRAADVLGRGFGARVRLEWSPGRSRPRRR